MIREGYTWEGGVRYAVYVEKCALCGTILGSTLKVRE
jgi:hypothetical protein